MLLSTGSGQGFQLFGYEVCTSSFVSCIMIFWGFTELLLGAMSKLYKIEDSGNLYIRFRYYESSSRLDYKALRRI